MKYPKKAKRYCKFCKKHTEQEVELAKRKTRRTLSQGQRRFLEKLKGYTSFPKENPKGQEKLTKRLDLRFKCNICHKMMTTPGWRTKKFEIVKG
ncbi:MAG TPA: 50S ribosomal protein L44e [archaeon]|nr:50S ribosomal protein L44e [archaeon]